MSNEVISQDPVVNDQNAAEKKLIEEKPAGLHHPLPNPGTPGSNNSSHVSESIDEDTQSSETKGAGKKRDAGKEELPPSGDAEEEESELGDPKTPTSGISGRPPQGLDTTQTSDRQSLIKSRARHTGAPKKTLHFGGLEEEPSKNHRGENKVQDIIVFTHFMNADRTITQKPLFVLENENEEGVPTIKFYEPISDPKVIPVFLAKIFGAATISPRLKDTVMIHIPLELKKGSGTLRIRLKNRNQIDHASFCHENRALTQWWSEFYFQSPIQKALRLIDKTTTVQVKTLPPIAEEIRSEIEDMNAESPPLRIVPDGKRDVSFASESSYDQWVFPTPQKPKNPSDQRSHEEYKILLPLNLALFSLKELTLERLEEIHKDYKLLKIQRLNNLGRGNAYQSLADPDALRVASKKFLVDLHICLEKKKPFWFRLARSFNTENYQAYSTAAEYLNQKEQEWMNKKVTQQENTEKKPKWSQRLDTDLLDFNSIEYKKRYNTFYSKLPKPTVDEQNEHTRAEKEKLLDTLKHNLAHTYATSKMR